MQCDAIVNVVAKICGCHLIKSAQQLRLSLRQTAHRVESTARKYQGATGIFSSEEGLRITYSLLGIFKFIKLFLHLLFNIYFSGIYNNYLKYYYFQSKLILKI